MKSLAVEKACGVVGGQAALARLVGVPPAFVFQWLNGKRPIPIERCPAIEQATSGAVTRKDLRPNDWASIWPELAENNRTPNDRRKATA